MSLPADEVARYLQNNPQFFEDHAEQIFQMLIPHPHTGRAIPITERQMLALRERNQILEARLSELLQFGEDNGTIADRMHRLALALVRATNLVDVLRSAHFQLREDFSVPLVSFCLWDQPATLSDIPSNVVIDDALQVLAETLAVPYCGGTHGFESVRWFGEASERVKSQALVVIKRGEQSVGMLAMGSEDPNRFFSGMGTLFLEQLGELLSAAIERTLQAE